ncbi:MAG: HypC/HybG/HupF family hydrogenase formation chaperone [Burkholderiales bacterium]|nr:HypC/HybG/HupF family hydrogenase formation chaperone [Burkholderiales bacterium]
MCIGVPMQVVEAGDGHAWCDGRGGRSRIDLAIVGPQPAGTWVLVFQGAARRVMSAEEAGQTNAALDALAAAIEGERDFGPYFADLVEREPRLPEHLRRES